MGGWLAAYCFASCAASRSDCARCGFRPRREAVRDHVLRQLGELRRQTQMIGQRGATRRDQRRAGSAQRGDGRIAQHAPVLRIAIGEFGIGAVRREIASALRIVEAQALVAEIAVQRRPQRIVIVDHDVRRETRREHVEAVTDQRRDDDRVDAMIAHDAVEQLAVRAVGDRRVGDRARQRNAQARRTLERAVVKLQPFAVPLARETSARDQHEMTRFAERRCEIAHPALGAAAPAVQHVQQHGSRIEAGSIRHGAGGKRGGDAFAQRGERRRRRWIARVRIRARVAHCGGGRVRIQMIEHDGAQAVRRERVRIGRRRVTELREPLAMPCADERAAQRCIDQPALAAGEAERIESFDVDVGRHGGRQGRAFRREVVERGGAEHAIAFERALQALDRMCRQLGIGADEDQRFARKSTRGERDELERIVDGRRFDVRRAVRRRCRRSEIRDRRLRCESCERVRRRRRRAEDAEPVGQLAGAAHGGVPSAGRQAVGRGAAADRCRYGGERGNEGRHAHGNPERWKARIIADPVADAWGCRRGAASDEISRSACRCGSRERAEAAIPDRLATRDATRVDSSKPSPGSRACPFPPEFSRFSYSCGACSARRS